MISKSYNEWLLLVEGDSYTVHNRITNSIHHTNTIKLTGEIYNILCTEDYLIINLHYEVICICFKTNEMFGLRYTVGSLSDRMNMSISEDTLVIPADSDNSDIYTLPNLRYVITHKNINGYNNDELCNEYGITKELANIVKCDKTEPDMYSVELSKVASRRITTDNWYLFRNDVEINLLMVYDNSVVLLIYNHCTHQFKIITDSELTESVSSYDTIYTYRGVNFVVNSDNVPQAAYLSKED